MPGSLLAQRAMMILACVFGTFGMIGAVASMDLVNAGLSQIDDIKNELHLYKHVNFGGGISRHF